jgi:cell division protein FtsZ
LRNSHLPTLSGRHSKDAVVVDGDVASRDVLEAHRIRTVMTAARPKVCVVGLGGAGCNMISWMKENGMAGGKLIAANTDAAHLSITKADRRILIGEKLTHGQGCGGHPEMGEMAAYESLQELKEAVARSRILLLCAGLGGGTGTGAITVLAKALRGEGVLTIGAVTLPFSFESYRYKKAKKALDRLRQYCDTVVAIDNNRLAMVAGDLPLQQALGVASGLVGQFVKGITETITTPSLINIDYADLKVITERRGLAAIGVGESSGRARVEKAAKKALDSKLLDVRDTSKAYGVLAHVTGGEDLKLDEVTAAGELLTKVLRPNVKIVWGARVESNMDGRVRVMVVLTGVEGAFQRHRESHSYSRA